MRQSRYVRQSRYEGQSDCLTAKKIINNFKSAENYYHQVEVEQENAQQQQISINHRGRSNLRTCAEGFEVTGPHGDDHLCLACEPLCEPLWLFHQQQFVDRRLPLPTAKAYLLRLLASVDLLHSECRVVYTGKSGYAIYFLTSWNHHYVNDVCFRPEAQEHHDDL